MKKLLKIFVVVLPVSALVAFGFNNCGRFGQYNGDNDYFQTNLGSSGGAANEVVVDSEKLGLPYALLSAEQTLYSMMRVANLTAPTTGINNEYNSRYTALAAGNDLSMANAPLMLGATSLAGEVCNTLLAQEKAMAAADRNFFGAINFATGVDSVNDEAFHRSVRGMARSFWGRLENTEELEMLKAYRVEFAGALTAAARTQAASTNNLMLATCAAMLSSVESISY